MSGSIDIYAHVFENIGPPTNGAHQHRGKAALGGQQQRRHDRVKKGNSARYKTELCRAFEESATCKYGDKCQFAHGRAELRTLARHPKYKTEFCRTYHSTGVCPYGPRCHFIHDPVEAAPQRSPFPYQPVGPVVQIPSHFVNHAADPRVMAPPVMPAAPSVQPVPVVPFDGAGSDPSFAAPGWDLAGHLGGLTLTDTTAAVTPADPVSLNSSQESQIQASTEEPVESSESPRSEPSSVNSEEGALGTSPRGRLPVFSSFG